MSSCNFRCVFDTGLRNFHLRYSETRQNFSSCTIMGPQNHKQTEKRNTSMDVGECLPFTTRWQWESSSCWGCGVLRLCWEKRNRFLLWSCVYVNFVCPYNVILADTSWTLPPISARFPPPPLLKQLVTEAQRKCFACDYFCSNPFLTMWPAHVEEAA